MFIWGQVHTTLCSSSSATQKRSWTFIPKSSTRPADHHLLSHCTMAPFVVDPELIRSLGSAAPEESRSSAAAQHPPQKEGFGP
jgi:hypothetical protein